MSDRIQQPSKCHHLVSHLCLLFKVIADLHLFFRDASVRTWDIIFRWKLFLLTSNSTKPYKCHRVMDAWVLNVTPEQGSWNIIRTQAE